MQDYRHEKDQSSTKTESEASQAATPRGHEPDCLPGHAGDDPAERGQLKPFHYPPPLGKSGYIVSPLAVETVIQEGRGKQAEFKGEAGIELVDDLPWG
ncbi:MAG: hypothetical protein ABSD45_20480, partial [Terriglobia bacterium]